MVVLKTLNGMPLYSGYGLLFEIYMVIEVIWHKNLKPTLKLGVAQTLFVDLRFSGNAQWLNNQ